ncbi:aldose 1-epimerase [Hwangdonia lutea]|uniref:Aldose 1-epimerase n=1 Tax=Hwangdonia lutea TaxID=3075823 RepID=A0AA97HSC6_9FLAO|nr:aldose 1-epimerase [Hwangdonia sp. SCSIO 19198]WOD44358.1 aldose 1-epimerase [Hwangdonia sp. SCSIO 19198]
MYSIKHQNENNVLELKNSDASFFAKIHLNDGASLQELTLNGKSIIVDLNPLVYADTYASAILFPFANRIKDGAYNFNKTHYQLDANNVSENNALHGLVYNKVFNVIEHKGGNESISVKLEYEENELTQGFPFTYSIQLEYVFTKDAMSLSVSVTNTSTASFPFTLGWHPYFLSENLYASDLQFSSHQKLKLGERNITTGVEKIDAVKSFNIEDKKLDDCWILNDDAITFNTPTYQFVIESSEEHNFLQVYTPPKENIIAIEPTTGVSDSFNNQIGLKVLKPNASYRIDWRLKMIK